MQIIGQTKAGFILDCTKDEAAKIRGHYSDYSLRDATKRDAAVGDQFDIGEMYQRASDTLSAYRDIQTQLAEMQKRTARLLACMAAGNQVEQKK